MGFVFQACDRSLSSLLEVDRVPYGKSLMVPYEQEKKRNAWAAQAASPATGPHAGVSAGSAAAAMVAGTAERSALVANALYGSKLVVAPMVAGAIESVVANRAEAQRFYGI